MSRAESEIIKDFLMGKRKLDSEVYAAIRAMYLSADTREKA